MRHMAKKWGPGNPLWEWQNKRKHRKANKSVKRHKSTVRHMARRRSRRHRFAFRKPKTIPLEVALTGIATVFTPPKSGWSSPWSAAQTGDMEGVADALISGFTPVSGSIKGGDMTIDIIGFLNPFNFEQGRYLKMLGYAGLASKVRKRVVKLPMNKIPVIGRIIS